MKGQVRAPFDFQGHLMVAVALVAMDGVEKAVAYHLMPLDVFGGTPTTYSDKVSSHEDPEGTYHGIAVT